MLFAGGVPPRVSRLSYGWALDKKKTHPRLPVPSLPRNSVERPSPPHSPIKIQHHPFLLNALRPDATSGRKRAERERW